MQLALLLHTPQEWAAQFERADVVSEREDSAGNPPGTVWRGWVCPDCGQVEVNEFALGLNHGWYPDHPGFIGQPPFGPAYDGRCVRLEMQARHAVYDARRAMVRHLCEAGLGDEEIAGRVGFWSAQTIAGFRKDDAKAARRAAKAARGEPVTVGHGDECPCAYCGGPCGCPSCREFRGDPAPAPDPQGALF